MVRKVKETENTATVSLGVRATGKAGKNAFYWKFLEFGTKFITARPFMRPAFENKKSAAAQAMREYMATNIPILLSRNYRR